MDVAALRQARREFARTHHPDRGGDAMVFADGLAVFDRLLAGSTESRSVRVGPVVVRHRPRGVSGWIRFVTRIAIRRRRHPRVR